MANVYQTPPQMCHVKSDNYATTITTRLYDHLVKVTLGDVLLSAEGKFIRAHKLILSISSEYFENMFGVNGMDKPIVIMPLGVKFSDLCLILDFAYLGQAQVPHESLDDFLKVGELLQIRGIKERRLNFVTTQPQPSMNRSFDSTISSTQETFTQPPTKRQREDDDISIQEASEIMKMLFENNLEIESEIPDAVTDTKSAPPPVQTFLSKNIMMQTQGVNLFHHAPPRMSQAAVSKKKPSIIGKKSLDKEKFPCRYCHRAMASKGRVTKHENECNENPQREVVNCDICNMELKPSAYTLHKNSKHGPHKSQPTSPDYSGQPSNLPMIMTSPQPKKVIIDVSDPHTTDPQITISPRASPTEHINPSINPSLPLQILKVEKIDPISDENINKDGTSQ